MTTDDFKTGNNGSTLRGLLSAVVSLIVVAALGAGVGRITGVWDPADPTAGSSGDRSRLGQGNESNEVNRRPTSRPRLGSKEQTGEPQGGRQASSLQLGRASDTGVGDVQDYRYEPRAGAIGTDPRAPIVSRSVTHSYNAAAIDGYGDECVGGNLGCVEFTARAGERFVWIGIDDSSGRVVRAWVKRDLDADGSIDGEWAPLCGRLEEPLPVVPGAIVQVVLQRGKCGSLDSAPTTGDVTATFFSGYPS